MMSFVKEFVVKCEACKSSKAPNYSMRPPMGSFEIYSLPCQRISIDFSGPYRRSKDRFIFIMIILDHSTKFTTLEPLRAATSDLDIRTLEKRVFRLFGVPESLVSDNGKQFTSNKFKSFLSSLKCVSNFYA